MKENTWGLFVLFAASLFGVAQAQPVIQSPQAVTAPAIISESAGGPSDNPVFSADGRFLAFVSAARNLVTNDDSRVFLNVYVRELATGNTRLASVNVTGVGGGNADSTYPMISSNGQYVFFLSSATDLEVDHPKTARDPFVRDMSANTTRSLHAPLDPCSATPTKVDEEITADGLHGVAVFNGSMPLISFQVTNNIFFCDYVAETNQLISVNTNGLSATNCQMPEVSGDGRYVSFISTALDLVRLTNTLQAQQIYLRDRQTQTTRCLGADARVLLRTSLNTTNALFSADGRYVVFVATASPNSAIIRLDLQTFQKQLIVSNRPPLSIAQVSADGRCVAYVDPGSVNSATREIHVWDAQTASNTLVNVSVSGTGVASGSFDSITLSRDGQRIAFSSDSSDLLGGSANGGLHVYVYDLPTGSLRLVTTNRDGSADPTMAAPSPVISPDGNRVAFVSRSSQFVDYDLNQCQDVFLYSMDTGATELVSRRAKSLPSATASGLMACGPSSISADGRYVAFAAYDGNLVSGDTNGFGDIFVRDTFTGKIVIASTDSTGALNTNSSPYNPQLSADGKRVLFSRPSIISATVTYGSVDLFIKDLNSGELITIATNLAQWVYFYYPPIASMSPDGKKVAFHTSSSLLPIDSNNDSDVYLWDAAVPGYQFLSITRTGGASSVYGGSGNPVFSSDGQWVIFLSQANDLGTNVVTSGKQLLYARNISSNVTHAIYDGSTTNTCSFSQISANSRYVLSYLFYLNPRSVSIMLHDLLSHQNVFIGANNQSFLTSREKAFAPSTVSADGTLIAYCSGTTTKQISVLNTQTGVSSLVSVASDGVSPGGGDSTMPVITSDGRFVIFSSTATNLLAAVTSSNQNYYARELSTGITVPLGRAEAGTLSSYPSYATPLLSGDGRTVLFRSTSDRVSPQDFNASRDLIVVRFGAADSDGDGMDDNWELAYFGTLSRNGTGDFDGDGISDLDEFRAGTDPTNQNSTVRALPVTTSNLGTTLYWNAVPGRAYAVEFKDSLSDGTWSLLGTVTPATSDGSATDPAGALGNQRFYRVSVLPK